MKLTFGQRHVLGQLRQLLSRGVRPDQAATETILEALGLTPGGYRLVSHLALFLFCQPVSPSARLYYGDDSLALSEQLLGARGRVLDLCAGAGAQALVCAQAAESVTAVDVEPFAEEIFRINAELNGLSEKVEFLVGDLFEPVHGRQFDLICSNPPFMPVAPGIVYPVFADGGPDGLAVVRRVLAGLPGHLAPGGVCHAVGAVLGTSEGPDLSPLEQLAGETRLAIAITCVSREELGASMLASCAATALAPCEAGEVKRAFREYFARLGASHIYYVLLRANQAPRPSIYFLAKETQRVTIGPAP